MILTRATPAHLPRLLQFRRDAATWLARAGSDQWALPFPPELISQSIAAGEVYLLLESLGSDPAATITLDQHADDLLWLPQEQAAPALYVHKLTVDRRYSGQQWGVHLLDWAGQQAYKANCQWLRLDAWTTNTRLHAYYEALGFQHVRTVDHPDTGGSGWVAQRPARPAPSLPFEDHT